MSLYSLRARYYAPALGRFLSPDTFPVDLNSPIELNRYVYAAGNPVNLTDPSGWMAVEYGTTTKDKPQQAESIQYFMARNTNSANLRADALVQYGLYQEYISIGLLPAGGFAAFSAGLPLALRMVLLAAILASVVGPVVAPGTYTGSQTNPSPAPAPEEQPQPEPAQSDPEPTSPQPTSTDDACDALDIPPGTTVTGGYDRSTPTIQGGGTSKQSRIFTPGWHP